MEAPPIGIRETWGPLPICAPLIIMTMRRAIMSVMIKTAMAAIAIALCHISKMRSINLNRGLLDPL